jgi:PAS domain S-box-containing protein
MDRIRAVDARLEQALTTRIEARELEAQAQGQRATRTTLAGFATAALLVLYAFSVARRQARSRRRADAAATETRHALERSNTELERRNQAFVLAMDEVAYQRDIVGGQIEWSGAVEPILGFSFEPTRREAAAALDRIHPDDRAVADAAFVRAAQERTLFECEYRYQRADGAWCWLHDRGVPQHDADGRMVRITGILRDISVRKGLEATLDEQRARLNAAFDQSAVGMVELSTDDRVLHANDRYCEIIGRKQGQVLGCRTAEFIHPDDQPERATALARLRSGRSRSYVAERRYLRPDGSVVWAVVSHTLADPGGGREPHVFTTVQDLTDRKRAEAALAEDRAWLAAALDQAAVGIVHGHLDGRLLRVNQRFCEIVGRSRDEVLARRFGDYTHPDDRGIELEWHQRLLAGFDAPFRFEQRYLRPDGSVVWTSFYVSVVHPEGIGERLTSAVVLDITVAKATQVALAMERRRLRSFVKTFTRSVEDERTRIAREIHDELGQAFTGLKMDVAWIRRRTAALAPLASTVVTERLDSMKRFIEDTIGVVRRIATELRPPLLDQLGLAAALRAYAGQFAARTDLACELVLAEVALDRDQATTLFRIAQEALSNIARHAQAHRFTIRLEQSDAGVTLELADDGIGTAAIDEAAGRSLGLVGIVERARLIGGDALFESAPGQGTRVRVVVPHAAPDAEEAAA